jgi:hypothetical protein
MCGQLVRSLAVVMLVLLRAHSAETNLTDLVNIRARQAQRLQSAVLVAKDFRAVKQVIAEGFPVDDPIGCGTFNCVDGAVETGNSKLLEWLLEQGAAPKGSALIYAARFRDPEVAARMVSALLKKGADANYEEFPIPGNKERFVSPLHVASYAGNVKVVKLLLAQPGIKLERMDVDGRTPQMWAAQRGFNDIGAMLRAAEKTSAGH